MAKWNIPATTIIPFLLRTCAIGAAFALSGCACNRPNITPTARQPWTLGAVAPSVQPAVPLPTRRPPELGKRQQPPHPDDPASKLILDLYLNQPLGE